LNYDDIINQINYKVFYDYQKDFIDIESKKIDSNVVVIEKTQDTTFKDFEFDYINNKTENTGMKSLSNCWSKIIDKSIEKGNQHFAITINLPKNPIYLCETYKFKGDYVDYNSSINNIMDFSGFTNEFGLNIVKNINGGLNNLKYVNCYYRDNILYSLYSCFEKNFPTILFFFSVIENKNNKYHLHVIISIKNFIDYNYILKENLQKCILLQLQYDYKELDWDIRVDTLNYFKDIKNWIMYMHKDIKNWHTKSLLFCDDCMYKQDNLNELFYIYNDVIKPSYSFDSYGFSIFYPPISDDELANNNQSKFLNTFLDDLYGIKIKDNVINQRTLINILQYYLILNNYYIYNDNIYLKIKFSKISYILVGSIKSLLYYNFQENVVGFFIKHLKMYFLGLDFNYLLSTYFIKTKSIIESIKDISTQRIEPDFGLIEFTDGIYSIKYDRFFSKKENFNFSNKISTVKYYNKSYQRSRKDKPITWINGLKNALNIKNNELTNEDFIRLCLHIINPIHKDIFNKKSSLFIHGKSNTGKTTLIADTLFNYFGSDNIGSIISAKNFKWQDLIGKKLGLVDEGRYNSSMSSDLLKITGQEKIIVEKKYSKEHIIINPIPLIILTNMLFEDKNKEIDEALKNRLYIIEFINIISTDSLNNSQEFKKKLSEEESNIIIYCNKLLFKIREDSLEKLGNKISNKKILKLIESNNTNSI
jgi:hypothetical protein